MVEERTAGSTAAGFGADIRRRQPERGGKDWRRDAADRAGLGDPVQRPGPDGLLDGKAPGKPSILNDEQRRALVQAIERGPIPAIHGVVRWRLMDLVQWLHEEFAVSLDETTVSRELRKLGYVKLTARPRRHAQNELAMEAFKKGASPPRWQRSGQPSRRARP